MSLPNLLKDPTFEEEWQPAGGHDVDVYLDDGSMEVRQIGNIFVLKDWPFWFKHVPGTWDQPEARDAWKHVDPVRVDSGDKAYMWFSFHRRHQAGVYQTANVGHNMKCKFTIKIQTWSNHNDPNIPGCTGNPRCSWGVGETGYFSKYEDNPPENGDPWNDAISNQVCRVGIDVTGGTSPYGPDVVWSDWHTIYNEYFELSVEAVSESHNVTVFMWDARQWPYRHNDVYIDTATLTAEPVTVDPPDPPPTGGCEVTARVPYIRTALLPPQGADRQMIGDIAYRGARRGWSTIPSADDAGNGDGLEERRVGIIDPNRWSDDIHEFFLEHYPTPESGKNPIVLWDIAPALDWMPYTPKSPYNHYQVEGRVIAADLMDIGTVLMYPVESPASRKPYITSEFGVDRQTYNHDGVDFRGDWPNNREQVRCMYPGKVIKAGYYGSEDYFGWQCVVQSVSPDGRTMDHRYAHMMENGVNVQVGQMLEYGELIGQIGTTGNSSGYHLHASLKCDGHAVDIAMLIDWDNWDTSPNPPEPPQEWPFRVREKGSKASYHALKPDGVPNALESLFNTAALPFTVKGVDDLGWLWYDCKLKYGDIPITIGRVFSHDEGCGQLHDGMPPQQMAAILMQHIDDKIASDPVHKNIDYWEVCNEPGGGGVAVSFHVDLAETMYWCAKHANDKGYKIATFAFNAGCPEWVDMEGMAALKVEGVGVFNYLFEHGHIIAVHEGILSETAPIDEGYGDTIPGAPHVDGAGSMCFRYKYLVAAVEASGQNCSPILVSEFYPGPRKGGNAQDVIERTEWYDNLARQDYRHWGTQIFTYGPYAQWDWSNMEYCSPAMEEYQTRIKDWQNTVPTDGEGPIDPPDPPDPPPANGVISVGIHDEAGMEHMNAHGIDNAVTVIPTICEWEPKAMNFSHLQGTVVCRLNYSWASPAGKGTIAPPNELEAHLNAIITTIRTSTGVDYWQLWNEVNNKSEWPTGFEVTPQYVIDAYNRVYGAVSGEGHKLTSPGAIDPKFGPGSDNSAWQEQIFSAINGCQAVLIHAGKSQTNDTGEIRSYIKFSDDPLKWQYLHSRDIETSIAMIPDRFKGLPLILGEVNPQRRTDTETGWLADNDEWVHEACAFIRQEMPEVTHVVFYRWADDNWRLNDKPDILSAIRMEAQSG